jgi:hypothetical protein
MTAAGSRFAHARNSLSVGDSDRLPYFLVLRARSAVNHGFGSRLFSGFISGKSGHTASYTGRPLLTAEVSSKCLHLQEFMRQKITENYTIREIDHTAPGSDNGRLVLNMRENRSDAPAIARPQAVRQHEQFAFFACCNTIALSLVTEERDI